MSRYTTVDKWGRTASYGFDHAIGYFADIEGPDGEPLEEIDCSSGRNSVIDFIDRYGIQMNSEHACRLFMDLPF